MSHSQSLSVQYPGLLGVILDVSGSMDAPFGGKAGGIKYKEAAKALNRVLRELGIRCTATDDQGNSYIKNRCEVFVLSYGSTVMNAFGGNLTGKQFVTMQELIENCLEIETVKVKVSDGAGSFIEVDDEFPIWIKPDASGSSTAMDKAFAQAYDFTSQWAYKHPESFPPIIINITDGEPNDMALAKSNALKLMDICTNDGATLIFNIHISSAKGLRKNKLVNRVLRLRVGDEDLGLTVDQFIQAWMLKPHKSHCQVMSVNYQMAMPTLNFCLISQIRYQKSC